jgi:hypothetical protein
VVVSWKAVNGEQVLTAEDIKRGNPISTRGTRRDRRLRRICRGDTTRGQDDALVTLVEFSDFECGHCANAYRSLKQVLPRYQKDVRVRFHHFRSTPHAILR